MNYLKKLEYFIIKMLFDLNSENFTIYKPLVVEHLLYTIRPLIKQAFLAGVKASDLDKRSEKSDEELFQEWIDFYDPD